ncbi:GNAT family N-acetyltransferase [Algoriphagus machipongonensis]|uniref:Acetyltransferase, GNAT family n=1 Tax=Algoriphagus machipongonensis TaxID=388413 RepID=A3HRM0_9BACT|nr:GNAT family N-acetyltransferase [Algoriphagus machipongonensis]EAZ82488.1 acetyltransferase, GNAT family [Algoriphagus machipongonensis]
MILTSTVKFFNELSVHELYEIIKLRNEVFVVEQDCVYQDADDKDQHSYHLMIKDGDSLLAYARILPPGISYPEVSIGRVVSDPKARRTGAGRKLMAEALDFVSQKFAPCGVRISAQTYLRAFYTSLGFKEEGEVYLEDGIEHVEMVQYLE